MIKPYISFNGQANAAIEFYEDVFGGSDKKIMRYSDMPVNQEIIPLHMRQWIGHAMMKIRGTDVCFCDFSDQEPINSGNQVTLMVSFDTVEELEKAYKKLSENGIVVNQILNTYYAKAVAWVRDRFGVGWQLICE